MAEIGRVLVLGAKGTLGGQFMRLYPEATGWDREEVDVLDSSALRARLDGLGFVPDAVVNCVAFNDVDGAEDRPEQAFALNAEFPGRLAVWTKHKGVPLVHYSTNYVFDGARGEYSESDAAAPLSAYGRSKWRGEQLVADNGGRWYVVRTAVIFGPKGESELSKKSFVDIMLDLAAKRDTIEAVADGEVTDPDEVLVDYGSDEWEAVVLQMLRGATVTEIARRAGMDRAGLSDYLRSEEHTSEL